MNLKSFSWWKPILGEKNLRCSSSFPNYVFHAQPVPIQSILQSTVRSGFCFQHLEKLIKSSITFELKYNGCFSVLISYSSIWHWWPLPFLDTICFRFLYHYILLVVSLLLLRPFIIQFLHGFLFLCQLFIVIHVYTISLYICLHTTFTSLNWEIVTKWNSIHVTICRFTSILLLRSNQSSLHYDTHHFYTVTHPATYSTII